MADKYCLDCECCPCICLELEEDDINSGECISCGMYLDEPGGYADTGLCETCCTGEANV